MTPRGESWPSVLKERNKDERVVMDFSTDGWHEATVVVEPFDVLKISSSLRRPFEVEGRFSNADYISIPEVKCIRCEACKTPRCEHIDLIIRKNIDVDAKGYLNTWPFGMMGLPSEVGWLFFGIGTVTEDGITQEFKPNRSYQVMYKSTWAHAFKPKNILDYSATMLGFVSSPDPPISEVYEVFNDYLDQIRWGQSERFCLGCERWFKNSDIDDTGLTCFIDRKMCWECFCDVPNERDVNVGTFPY